MSTISYSHLSPEAKLLITSVSRALSLREIIDESNPREIQSINSDYLLSLAVQNGVEGFLDAGYHSNEQAEWQKRLKLYLQQKRLNNLSILGEFLRLQARFRQEGIPILGFKGPVLAHQLFGDISRRSFCDLDLLVKAKDLETVEELLQAWGYQPRQTTGVSENGDRYFVNISKGVFVDLHSAFTPSYYPVPLDYKKLWEDLISIDLQGMSVLAFPPETLLILLCVHGTKDNWKQMKWVCDIAQLLKKHPHLNWDYIINCTSDFRVRQALVLGINLCQAMFGYSLSVPERFDLALKPLQKILISNILSRQLENPNRPLSFFENVLFCWVRAHVYPFRRWVEEKVLPNEHDKLFHGGIKSVQNGYLNRFHTLISFLVRPLRLTIKFFRSCFIAKPE